MCKFIIKLLCNLILFIPSLVMANTAFQLFIESPIGPATATYVQEGIEKANNEHAQLIILQLDTPGGLDTSMRKIVQDILNSSIPVVTYVTPAGARAASAGVFILYASHIAAMAPGTNLGAATPISLLPDEQSTEKAGVKRNTYEKKAVNDAAAYIRSLAQLRNRNAEWGELAVTKAASLTAVEAQAQHVIDVVASNQTELLARINGFAVKVQNKTYKLDTTHLVIQEFKPNWIIQFLSIITNPNVAYILILIGIYGLIYEFANPGLVMPGVFGAIALLLGLYSFHLLPISYTGLALILLGIIFMLAEAFIGSFGLLAIGGIVAFVLGSLFLLEPVPGFNLALSLIVIVSIISAAFFFFLMSMVLRSRARPIVSGIEEVIGAEAILIKDEQGMRVRIHGELWQVQSFTALVDGQKVRVIAVKELILVVEAIS